jgi:hypothetical protein
MVRTPVTFGGGIKMEYGFFCASGFDEKRPD